jgi:leader peptidase (prepilin peptidase)/N-methyltransferase
MLDAGAALVRPAARLTPSGVATKIRPMPPEPLLPAVALVFGLFVGSFANVCIHRLPRGESVVFPGSACPHCRTPIRPWHNIPVLSFLLLRGRCAACRAPIAWRYPLVEAANGALWLGLVLTFGPHPATLVKMVLTTALLVLALIDFEHLILPDVITLPGVAVGLLAAGFVPGWPIGWKESALTALGAYLAFGALDWLWCRLRKVEVALGQGDWKLVALLGASVGWHMLLLIVFLASLGGTLVGFYQILTRKDRDMGSKLPLGTYLAAAGVAALFVGRRLLSWYGGLGLV